MTERTALICDAIFDGMDVHRDAALILRGGRVDGVVARAELARDVAVRDLGGGILAPGFVDLQVNGGGGLMFNAAPDTDTLAVMAQAHAQLGVTGFLATLITDTPARTIAAIEAVAEAVEAGLPGLLGLHLEGPHLDPVRCGAHDPELIRPMDGHDLAVLLAAGERLPVLMVTLAPKSATPAQIRALAAAGVVVSLGHSDAGFDAHRAATEAGASCVTHLFNAMSPLGSREPGLVGAALTLGGLSAGLIADGVHVHPETIRMALAAKQGPGALFLVSDAMATAGSDITSFTLGGREIRREGDRLSLADGTLAGAHLDLARALRIVRAAGGVELASLLAMATRIPAAVAGVGARAGHLGAGRQADFVHLSDQLDLLAVWRGGQRIT